MADEKVIVKCIDDIIEKLDSNEPDTKGTKENPYIVFVNEQEYETFKSLFNEENMRCADCGWQKLVLVPKRAIGKVTILSSGIQRRISGPLPNNNTEEIK